MCPSDILPPRPKRDTSDRCQPRSALITISEQRINLQLRFLRKSVLLSPISSIIVIVLSKNISVEMSSPKLETRTPALPLPAVNDPSSPTITAQPTPETMPTLNPKSKPPQSKEVLRLRGGDCCIGWVKCFTGPCKCQTIGNGCCGIGLCCVLYPLNCIAGILWGTVTCCGCWGPGTQECGCGGPGAG